jgi:hypothetical protein
LKAVRRDVSAQQCGVRGSPYHFHTLKLETPLPLAAADRYAFVVSAPADASCEVQINTAKPYPEGDAFLQGPDSSTWSRQAGTVIRFRTLVSH